MAFNILVVDDSRTVRSVICKALRLAKVPTSDVIQAEDGQQALDILAERWVDLVFADINMPVMTGVEMIEKLNEHGLLRTIPVVVVSTEGSQTRIDELKGMGVRGFVRKPFRPEQLRDVIEEVLGKYHE